MGLTSSKQQNTESLNWDKINTESMSTTLPNVNNISKDANLLISTLTINDKVDLENTESENENLFTWIKTIGDNKNKEPINNTDSFSETSAFISSDMYKYLMNKNSESATSAAQVGGGIQEDSSTSSTSSSPKKKSNKKKVVTTSSSMSGGDLSYISSSPHTENNESNVLSSSAYTNTNKSNVLSSSADYEETSISVGNNQMLTSSINTEDINLVEESSD